MLHFKYFYAERMLNVLTLRVIMLSFKMPRAIMLSVNMLRAIMLSFKMLNVRMLNINLTLNVVMLFVIVLSAILLKAAAPIDDTMTFTQVTVGRMALIVTLSGST